MQNITQEAQGGHGGAQTGRPKTLADIMAECGKLAAEQNVIIETLKKQRKEFSYLLGDELKLYRCRGKDWSQNEFQDTVLRWKQEISFIDRRLEYHEKRLAFFKKVIELAFSSVEHAEQVMRLQEQLEVIEDRHALKMINQIIGIHMVLSSRNSTRAKELFAADSAAGGN